LSPGADNQSLPRSDQTAGMARILIVEDDAVLALGLQDALQGAGYQTHTAHTGTDGLRLADACKPDLILLDVMLPRMSGFEVCKRLRDQGNKTHIIMLTSKAEETDKVLGLELGADDYVTKPFGVRELLARIAAHLRRQERTAALPDLPEKYCLNDVEIDFRRHEVTRAGERQQLTHREFELLEYFVRHPGELLTRDRLLDEIWGYDAYPTTRTVDNHILRLRKHIEPNPEKPCYIKTVHGVGYLFEVD